MDYKSLSVQELIALQDKLQSQLDHISEVEDADLAEAYEVVEEANQVVHDTPMPTIDAGQSTFDILVCEEPEDAFAEESGGGFSGSVSDISSGVAGGTGSDSVDAVPENGFNEDVWPQGSISAIYLRPDLLVSYFRELEALQDDFFYIANKVESEEESLYDYLHTKPFVPEITKASFFSLEMKIADLSEIQLRYREIYYDLRSKLGSDFGEDALAELAAQYSYSYQKNEGFLRKAYYQSQFLKDRLKGLQDFYDNLNLACGQDDFLYSESTFSNPGKEDISQVPDWKPENAGKSMDLKSPLLEMRKKPEETFNPAPGTETAHSCRKARKGLTHYLAFGFLAAVVLSYVGKLFAIIGSLLLEEEVLVFDSWPIPGILICAGIVVGVKVIFKLNRNKEFVFRGKSKKEQTQTNEADEEEFAEKTGAETENSKDSCVRIDGSAKNEDPSGGFSDSAKSVIDLLGDTKRITADEKEILARGIDHAIEEERRKQEEKRRRETEELQNQIRMLIDALGLNQETMNQIKEISLRIKSVSEEEADQLADQMRNIVYQDRETQLYRRKEEELKVTLASIYDMLCEETKSFLITGSLILEKIRNQQKCEFSGVCVLLSKAVEAEFKERYFTEYKAYLEEKFARRFSEWPSSMLFNGKQKEFCSMGDFPFIMGQKQTGNYMNDTQSRKCFFAYASDVQLKQDLDRQEIQSILEVQAADLEFIRKEYRNPSAHTEIMSLEKAESCIRLIVTDERLLEKLMANFRS